MSKVQPHRADLFSSLFLFFSSFGSEKSGRRVSEQQYHQSGLKVSLSDFHLSLIQMGETKAGNGMVKLKLSKRTIVWSHARILSEHNPIHLNQAIKWIKLNCKMLCSPVVYHRGRMAKVWRHGTLSRAPHVLCTHSQHPSCLLAHRDHLEIEYNLESQVWVRSDL